MTNHLIVLARDPDPEFAPDVDIECPGVTDACAEWIECMISTCPGKTDSSLFGEGDVGHGVQHRNIQGAWMVRSGFCFAENHGHGVASEFVERHELGAGRHEVIPEFEDDTLVDFAPVTAMT